MSKGQNTATISINLLTLIPSFIALIERFASHASGKEKKAAVIGMVTSIGGIGLGAVAGNNPNYAGLVNALGPVIDEAVKAMNNAKVMPKPEDHPTDGPPPAQPTQPTYDDPTKQHYATATSALDARDAINAKGGQHYEAVKRTDGGFFSLWPVGTGGAPGEVIN